MHHHQGFKLTAVGPPAGTTTATWQSLGRNKAQLPQACQRLSYRRERQPAQSAPEGGAPSVVPPAKLKPMAGEQVRPARVQLLAATSTALMSTYAWRASTGPARTQLSTSALDFCISLHATRPPSVFRAHADRAHSSIPLQTSSLCNFLATVNGRINTRAPERLSGCALLLPSQSAAAASACRRAMTSLLRKPKSSASQAGPRPMHSSVRPPHVLCCASHGSPARGVAGLAPLSRHDRRQGQ